MSSSGCGGGDGDGGGVDGGAGGSGGGGDTGMRLPHCPHDGSSTGLAQTALLLVQGLSTAIGPLGTRPTVICRESKAARASAQHLRRRRTIALQHVPQSPSLPYEQVSSQRGSDGAGEGLGGAGGGEGGKGEGGGEGGGANGGGGGTGENVRVGQSPQSMPYAQYTPSSSHTPSLLN